MPATRAIIMVWDGLRPDSVNASDTPNLYALRQSGVNFSANHSTYPTFTMMNGSSFDAHAREQTFEQAFSVKGEPAATHFKATDVANGAQHQLEVWRDANRIRRNTGDSAETYAERKPGGAGYSLSPLDLKRKIHTDIDRDKLYRIGNFTDRFDLGHGLRHPKGQYRLTAARAAPGAPAPIAPCGWVDLVQDGRVTHVCWSNRSRLPLLIATGDGRIVWRVTDVDHKPIAAATFALHDAGFVRNDANRDIEQD